MNAKTIAKKHTKPVLTFNMNAMIDPIRRADMFAAARAIDPRVDGYIGSDREGSDYFQALGVTDLCVIVKSKKAALTSLAATAVTAILKNEIPAVCIGYVESLKAVLVASGDLTQSLADSVCDQKGLRVKKAVDLIHDGGVTRVYFNGSIEQFPN